MESNENLRIPWPGWQAVRRLGGGGFGTVYEIERDLYGIKERDAMKVIHLPKDRSELENDYSSGMTAEEIRQKYDFFQQRMVDEYRQMLEFRGHNNIVNCHDFSVIPNGQHPGCTIYIRMELLTPLRDALIKEGFSEFKVIRLGIDICQALVLLRQKNKIHRDIKPENIMVSASGSFKLGDFGLARTMEQTMSATLAGTTWYMAPEVVKKLPYGKGADIYSLGLVLYWLLNGYRLPFVPIKDKITTKDMEAAFHLRMQGKAIPEPAAGSRELKAIVLKAIAYERAHRFRTADEMLEALRALKEAQSPVQPTQKPVQPAQKPAQKPVQPAQKPVQPAPRPASTLNSNVPWLSREILGIYLDTREINVCMWIDGKVRQILKLPAVFITTAVDETLAGTRAQNYQKCHKDEKLYSVLELMRRAEKNAGIAGIEYAQTCCKALMKNLRSQLDQTLYGDIKDCVVSVSVSSLPLFRSIKYAMEEAGFRVDRILTASVACTISSVYFQKQKQRVKLCLTADGERQAIVADCEEGLFEILENRIVTSKKQMDDWAKAEQRIKDAGSMDIFENIHLSDDDGLSRMVLAAAAAQGAAILGANLKGQLSGSFLLLDLFPWKLGLEVVDANQAVCFPLTWMKWNEVESYIPSRSAFPRQLNVGVRGKTLRLYAGDAASGQEPRTTFSSRIIQEWNLETVCKEFRTEPKHLEIDFDLSKQMPGILLIIKNPETGEKKEIHYLQSGQGTPYGVQITSDYIPRPFLSELGMKAERFRTKAEAPVRRGVELAIRQGTFQVAKQSTELLRRYNEGSAHIPTDMFIEEMLRIADNLEQGLKAAQRAGCTDEHTLLLSFYKIIGRALHQLGLVEIEAEGMRFNPHIHEALIAEHIAGVENDMVIDEIQKGYIKDGRVLRPAKVRVTTDPYFSSFPPNFSDSDILAYS